MCCDSGNRYTSVFKVHCGQLQFLAMSRAATFNVQWCSPVNSLHSLPAAYGESEHSPKQCPFTPSTTWERRKTSSQFFCTHSSPTDNPPGGICNASCLVSVCSNMYIYIYIHIYINGTIYTAWNHQVGQRSQSAIDRACVKEKDWKSEVAPLLASWRCKTTKGASVQIPCTQLWGPTHLLQPGNTPPCSSSLHKTVALLRGRKKKNDSGPSKCHLGHLVQTLPNWLIRRAASVWFPQKHLSTNDSYSCSILNSYQWPCLSKALLIGFQPCLLLNTAQANGYFCMLCWLCSLSAG